MVPGQIDSTVGGTVVGGTDVGGTAVGADGTVAEGTLGTVDWTLMNVAVEKLVTVLGAMVLVTEIDVFIGKTVKLVAVNVSVAIVVKDAVLVAVLVAIITMGVSVGTAGVAVLAVASAWAVSTIMVGILATSIVGIGPGMLIPVVEQASETNKIDMEKNAIRFMVESSFINGIRKFYFRKYRPAYPLLNISISGENIRASRMMIEYHHGATSLPCPRFIAWTISLAAVSMGKSS